MFPKSDPNLPSLDPGLEESAFNPLFGEVDRRWGENASLSLPTGDAPRLLFAPTSMVLECCTVVRSGTDEAESTRVVSEGAVESTVSEAMSGEERVE